MNWHHEQAIGIDAATEAFSRVLGKLKPFQCVIIEAQGNFKMAVFQKPWTGTLFVVETGGQLLRFSPPPSRPR